MKVKFKNLKHNKGQALILVIMISLISLALVLGTAARNNTQQTIQRQNSEYQVAFDYAESSIQGLISILNSGSVSPYSSSSINTALKNSNILPCSDIGSTGQSTTTGCDYNINVDTYNASNNIPIVVDNDQSLLVQPFNKTSSSLQNLTVWCPISIDSTSIPEGELFMEIYYKNNSSYNSDNVSVGCTDQNNRFGLFSSAGSFTNQNGYKLSALTRENYTINNHIYTFQKYIIIAPSNRTAATLASIRVLPKFSFIDNQSISGLKSAFILKACSDATNYDPCSASALIVSSNPITGTAIGYSRNSRTATISFQIPTTIQMPSFFNYGLLDNQ